MSIECEFGVVVAAVVAFSLPLKLLLLLLVFVLAC